MGHRKPASCQEFGSNSSDYLGVEIDPFVQILCFLHFLKLGYATQL